MELFMQQKMELRWNLLPLFLPNESGTAFVRQKNATFCFKKERAPPSLFFCLTNPAQYSTLKMLTMQDCMVMLRYMKKQWIIYAPFGQRKRIFISNVESWML
jgi:hypothetical protein